MRFFCFRNLRFRRDSYKFDAGACSNSTTFLEKSLKNWQRFDKYQINSIASAILILNSFHPKR